MIKDSEKEEWCTALADILLLSLLGSIFMSVVEFFLIFLSDIQDQKL
jgi:hypothetical protein